MNFEFCLRLCPVRGAKRKRRSRKTGGSPATCLPINERGVSAEAAAWHLAKLGSTAKHLARRPRSAGHALSSGPPCCVFSSGSVWRTARFLCGFPIWGDEAMVLVDVHDRDYHGLNAHPVVCPGCPAAVSLGRKTALVLLGTSEFAVRLLPFLAGSAGLVLFAYLAQRVLPPVHGALAIAVLAVSYYPLRHCCEVKPYGLDLLMSAGMLLGALGWLADPRHTRWLVFLALWAPLAMLSSYPAPFVGGGMSLLLLPKVWHATWKSRGFYAIFNLLMAMAFLAHYFGIARHQIDAPQALVTHEHMDAAWHESFPPNAVSELPLWLLRIHAGLMLAYPIGGPNGGSAASLLYCVLGAWHLWSRGQRTLLLACVLPFALTLFAAFLHKYPYGGSAPVAQHLAPMACILIAAGGSWFLERPRMPAARWRWACVSCLLLAAIGVAGMARRRVPAAKKRQRSPGPRSCAVFLRAGGTGRRRCAWQPAGPHANRSRMVSPPRSHGCDPRR